MAKRLGNYYILRDVVAKGHDPMAIRYLMISTHYRQQINFTFDGLGAAQKALERLRNFALRSFEADGRPAGPKLSELIAGVQKLFGEAMDDDLNISVALAYLFDFVRDVNNLLNDGMVSKEEGREIHDLMMRFDGVLGVVGEVKTDRKLSQAAEDLVRKREEARKAKDWKTADQIREQLKSMGVLIEDTSEGIRWKLEKK
jgi:cysteinyl-tRNA synthetase